MPQRLLELIFQFHNIDPLHCGNIGEPARRASRAESDHEGAARTRLDNGADQTPMIWVPASPTALPSTFPFMTKAMPDSIVTPRRLSIPSV